MKAYKWHEGKALHILNLGTTEVWIICPNLKVTLIKDKKHAVSNV
jgi:hypothetical protein